jgi:hypothetical protein
MLGFEPTAVRGKWFEVSIFSLTEALNFVSKKQHMQKKEIIFNWTDSIINVQQILYTILAV